MNNILTVFHGYVGLMLDSDALDTPIREGLNRIKAGARAASVLMDRTHALVRQPALVWREIELASFLLNLRPAIEALRPVEIPFELQVCAELPNARADASRLRTALLELLRNAFEATAGIHGAVVSLEVSAAPLTVFPSDPEPCPGCEPETRSALKISIVDTGPGIAPANLSKIFQPFFTTRRKSEATGLGLNVAQGLIQQCGGFLQHQPHPNQTRFEILLPAA